MESDRRSATSTVGNWQPWVRLYIKTASKTTVTSPLQVPDTAANSGRDGGYTGPILGTTFLLSHDDRLWAPGAGMKEKSNRGEPRRPAHVEREGGTIDSAVHASYTLVLVTVRSITELGRGLCWSNGVKCGQSCGSDTSPCRIETPLLESERALAVLGDNTDHSLSLD